MTLDEAIKHLEETLSDKSHKWSCESCKQEHEQLLEWLKELKATRHTISLLIHAFNEQIKKDGAENDK